MSRQAKPATQSARKLRNIERAVRAKGYTPPGGKPHPRGFSPANPPRVVFSSPTASPAMRAGAFYHYVGGVLVDVSWQPPSRSPSPLPQILYRRQESGALLPVSF